MLRPRPGATVTLAERSRERYRRAALTTVVSLGAQGVATISTLVYVPIALGYVGAERSGLWASVIPLGIATRVQMGYQEGFVNGLWQASGSIFGLLGLFIAIALRANLPWLVLGFAGGPVLSAGFNAIALFARRRWLRPTWSAVRRD